MEAAEWALRWLWLKRTLPSLGHRLRLDQLLLNRRKRVSVERPETPNDARNQN